MLSSPQLQPQQDGILEKIEIAEERKVSHGNHEQERFDKAIKMESF